MPGRHTFSFDDHEAAVAQRAMMAYSAVLGIQTITTAAAEMIHEADLAARLSSRIQRHSTGLCNCPLPPVLGGTHT
jgi:hypothetical protein